MADVTQDLVNFAHRLADAAAPVTLRYFRDLPPADIKADGSPVTKADQEAEKAMRDLIHAKFSGHGVLGEEHGAQAADSEWCWVLDPVDGTRAFMAGIPTWGTLIALCHRGVPVLGLLDQPVLKER